MDPNISAQQIPVNPIPANIPPEPNTNKLRFVFIGTFAIIFLVFFIALVFMILNKNTITKNNSNQQNKTTYDRSKLNINAIITPKIINEKPSKEIYIDIKNQLKQAFK